MDWLQIFQDNLSLINYYKLHSSHILQKLNCKDISDFDDLKPIMCKGALYFINFTIRDQTKYIKVKILDNGDIVINFTTTFSNLAEGFGGIIIDNEKEFWKDINLLSSVIDDGTDTYEEETKSHIDENVLIVDEYQLICRKIDITFGRLKPKEMAIPLDQTEQLYHIVYYGPWIKFPPKYILSFEEVSLAWTVSITIRSINIEDIKPPDDINPGGVNYHLIKEHFNEIKNNI